MSMQAFTTDELEVRKTIPARRGKVMEFFKTPISSRENILRMYEGKTPMWLPFTDEMQNLKPDCDPENVARGSKTGGVDGNKCEEILRLIKAGRLDPSFLITHRYALKDAMAAYDLFEKKEDGVIKVALVP